jgi:transposase
LRQDRTEATATALVTQDLSARQRGAITAVCTDMHRPYLNAVGATLPRAEIVFDKFHVLQHASAARDDVRLQEFFRAGAVMRAHGRGKRQLLLRRWKTVRGSKRRELQTLFAANRRLFKAYVLREQLDRLWTYKTTTGRAELPERVDQRAALAASAGDGSTRRVSVSPRRGHRRVLRSSRPLRRGRIDQHHDQGCPSARAWHAR